MLRNGFADVLTQILPVQLPIPLRRLAAGAIGLTRLEDVYRRLMLLEDCGPISTRLLSFLDVRTRVSDTDLARIPRTGPAIVVANHPQGILDGAILHDMLTNVRSDVKFLANGILNVVPELREFLIYVDPIADQSAASRNLRGLRQAYEHVASGGLIVIFPAGEVSHLKGKSFSVADPEWNNIVPRLVSLLKRSGSEAAIVPVHISGRNSALFQVAGLLHPRLRTALLGRELLNKRGREVKVSIANRVSSTRLMELPSDRERTEYLRWRTHQMAKRGRNRPLVMRKPQVAPPSPQGDLQADISALDRSAMLTSAGELHVYIATALELPNILPEIGRLREQTFRAAGEGTGKPIDIDEFDTHYLHLFLWNSRRHEVAGAYRLAPIDRVRKLYTATLFDYTDEFLDQIRPAIELGRSFIRPEYQRSFNALLLLWKGIGRYVARHPRYKVLFGPVSISNDYQPASRELMIDWLERNTSLPTWKRLVSGRRSFRSTSKRIPETWISGLDDLSNVVADLEPDERGVPILLRQYLKLGGKLLAFNVDPKFSNAVDGLIVVDLTQTGRKFLDRYLGAIEAATFLDSQKGTYAA